MYQPIRVVLIGGDHIAELSHIVETLDHVSLNIEICIFNDLSEVNLLLSATDLILVDDSCLGLSQSLCQQSVVIVVDHSNNIAVIEHYLALPVADVFCLPLIPALIHKRLFTHFQAIRKRHCEDRYTRQLIKIRELGTLVSYISHEVASPMGNVNTAVSYLLEATNGIKSQIENRSLEAAQMDKFIHNAQRALGMSINNCANASNIITAFRSIAVNQCFEKCCSFYLHRYLDDIVISLKSKLKNLPHEIHIVINESVQLNTYAGVFAQVIYNLIDKSLNHGFAPKTAGTIIINSAEETTADGQEMVIINYIDDGKGIVAADIPKLFAQQSVATVVKGTKATGHQGQDLDRDISEREHLSMVMLKTLVEENLQGTFVINTNTTKGVHFIMTIPRVIGNAACVI